jgi:hypothetical protein
MWTITITTKCGTGIPTDGLKFGTAGKDQAVTVKFGATTKTIRMFISPRRFTKAHCLSFWSNSGQKNNFGFTLQLSQTIPAGGSIWAGFPNRRGNIHLFKTDLGTGKQNGEQVDC